jgi:hypothetical protein
MVAKPDSADNPAAKNTDPGLHELVAQAYESACNPEGLPAFIRDTARLFAAPQSAVAIWTEHDPANFLPITFGMDDGDLERMSEQRRDDDSLFARLGKLRTGETIIAPVGAMRLLAGLVSVDADNHCAIILCRDAQDRKFKPSDQQPRANLVACYRRALALNKRFVQISVEHNDALDISVNTARSELKKIFKKVGVSSQSQLLVEFTKALKDF